MLDRGTDEQEKPVERGVGSHPLFSSVGARGSLSNLSLAVVSFLFPLLFLTLSPQRAKLSLQRAAK